MSELNPNAPSREGWAYYIYGWSEERTGRARYPESASKLEWSSVTTTIPRCAYQEGSQFLTSVTAKYSYSSTEVWRDQDPVIRSSEYSFNLDIETGGFFHPTTHYWVNNQDIIILKGAGANIRAFFAERTAMGRLASLNFGVENYSEELWSQTRSAALACTTAPISDPYGDRPGDKSDTPCEILVNPDGSCNCCAIGAEVVKILS